MMSANITKLLFAFLLVSLNLPSFSQNTGNVHGRVVGANNAAMPGVSIMVLGTSKGTTTNSNGEYTINAGPQDSLVFSYVGFIEQHVGVAERNVNKYCSFQFLNRTE
jgi:hypothetical protein